MRSQIRLFIATALIEAGVGVLLLSLPALVIRLLLGVVEPSPEALVVGHVCGAALLAIGVACWLARDDCGSRSQHGLVWGMLTYNVGACGVLGFTGTMTPLCGVLLWPAVALHAALAVWCLACLRASASDS